MRHSIRVEGYAFDLRPVELSDAQFIVAIRTAEASRVRYLHPISPDVELQRAWIARYFDRAGDYYWVIERRATRRPEGLIGIYGLDAVTSSAEWGRWILSAASLGAVESALLIYRAAFDRLMLDFAYCITVAHNESVLSFHDSCGLKRVGLLQDRFTLEDGVYDGVKHECSKAGYPAVVQRLESQAKMICQRLSRSP